MAYCADACPVAALRWYLWQKVAMMQPELAKSTFGSDPEPGFLKIEPCEPNARRAEGLLVGASGVEGFG